MERLKETLKGIEPIDRSIMERAQAKLDSLTKPQGSLGRLEELARQVCGIVRDLNPVIRDKVIVVMAGDHGVTEEGVSAFPQEVTPQMVLNFTRGGAGINVLARHVGARVTVVDMGVASKLEIKNEELKTKKVGYGTNNFTKGPAMTREDAIASLERGIEIAGDEVKKGASIIGTGDMGIGNTTPSSAILTVFSDLPLERLVGRGTGINNGQLDLKVKSVKKALKVNEPDSHDPLDVLAKVGGFEIGGLAGCILGAAACRVPVVIDGFISGAAALIAGKLAPVSREYMIASHVSAEPGHWVVLEELGLNPTLYLDMRLGEGTGAALGINLVEASCRVLSEMATFAEASVSESM